MYADAFLKFLQDIFSHGRPETRGVSSSSRETLNLLGMERLELSLFNAFYVYASILSPSLSFPFASSFGIFLSRYSVVNRNVFFSVYLLCPDHHHSPSQSLLCCQPFDLILLWFFSQNEREKQKRVPFQDNCCSREKGS